MAIGEVTVFNRRRGGSSWRSCGTIVLALIVLIYPIVLGTGYVTYLLFLFSIWAVVALSWDLIMGYAGVFNFAHIAFFAIGGYSSGIFSKYFGILPFLSPVLGAITTTIIVIIFIALPALRLPGVYIGLYSIMFHLTLPSLLTQTRKWSGGSTGLTEIPPILPNAKMLHYYYMGFALLFVTLLVIRRVIDSPTGQALMALRDSREFARSLGVNEYKEKVKVFGISAFLVSLAGGLYAHYMRTITPTTLGVTTFLLALAMVYLGGLGRFPGALLGAGLIVFADEFFRSVGMFRHIVLGSLIVFVVLFFPKGLSHIFDVLARLTNKVNGKR